MLSRNKNELSLTVKNSTSHKKKTKVKKSDSLIVFQALTLVKTCEPVAEMRECRAPRDWSLLALQNVRTGKSHYLVICRCPDTNILGKYI